MALASRRPADEPRSRAGLRCSRSPIGTAAAADAARRPQASRVLVATGSLSARCDQLCAAVAPHEQRCRQRLSSAPGQATGSPPVACTLNSVRCTISTPITTVQGAQQLRAVSMSFWCALAADVGKQGAKQRARAHRFRLSATRRTARRTSHGHRQIRVCHGRDPSVCRERVRERERAHE